MQVLVQGRPPSARLGLRLPVLAMARELLVLATVAVSLAAWITTAQASVELPVYRMQHYELLGIARGSKASSLSGEAVSWSALSQLRSGAGRVAVLRWAEISHLREAVAKGVSGVILVMPHTEQTAVSAEKLNDYMALEHDLFQEVYPVAIYVVRDCPEIRSVLSRASSAPSSSAIDLSSLWSGTTTQLSVQAPAPKQITTPRFPTLWGKLVGFGLEEQLPTVTVVAHYDAFGAAAALASGADSNASGVAALLELARLFSRLYAQSKTHPRANLVFVLSAAGKLNYLGTKKLIDDAVEGSNNAESSLLADAQFSLCLEAVGSRPGLYAHVSKPPRADHAMGRFFELLNGTQQVVAVVHKKINLAEEMRVWEHERFSLNKLAAFTLSSHASHNVRSRYSIFDRHYDLDALETNVRQIAASLAAFVYAKQRSVGDDLLQESLAVDKQHLKAVMDYLTSEPRSAVLHAARGPATPLVATLKQMLARFVAQVRTSHFEPDRREPELIIFDQTEATLNVNEVKPVMFDLVLLGCIAVYLFAVYLVLANFGSAISALSSRSKKID